MAPSSPHEQLPSDATFQFLDLPHVARYRIYELLFTAPRGYVHFFDETRLHGRYRKPAKIQVNILRTCKEIYHEARTTLYRVNNFCAMPFQRINLPWMCCVEPDNIQWFRSMPPWSRALIKRLELRIPLISEPNCGHCRQTMRGFFPSLEYLVLFYPHTASLINEATLPQNLAYYTELAQRLPIPRISTSFDLRNVRDTPLSANLINALAIAINKDPDTERMVMQLSFHVTYEMSCYEETVQQAALVDAELCADILVGPVLVEEYHAGDRGEAARQLDWYYGRRAELRTEEYMRHVEDESEEEARLFRDWDGESATKAKKQRIWDWKYPRPRTPPTVMPPAFNHFHDADEWDEPQSAVGGEGSGGGLVNVVGGPAGGDAGNELVVVSGDGDADAENANEAEEPPITDEDADPEDVMPELDSDVESTPAEIVQLSIIDNSPTSTNHEDHDDATPPITATALTTATSRFSSIGHINTEYDHYDGDDEEEDAYVFDNMQEQAIVPNNRRPRARFPLGRMVELWDGKYSGWYLPKREMLEW